jgi:hypothetical protein
MAGNTERKSLEKSVAFVSRLTGMPKRLINYVIRAYCTYLLLELYQGRSCHVLYLGTLSPKKEREKREDWEKGEKSVTYTPTSRIKKFVYLNRKPNVNSIVDSYKNYLKSGRIQKELEKFNTYSLDYLEDTSTGLKNRAYIKSQANVDMIRNSLLLYLQQKFPYDLDWCHPVTNNIYSHTRIADKLKMYRQVDVEGYNILYSVWLGISDRCELIGQIGLSEILFEKKLRQVMDSVVLLIVYSDLESEGLLSCYTSRLLGLEPD